MKINFLLEGRIYGWELQKKGNSKVDDSVESTALHLIYTQSLNGLSQH